MFMPMNCNANLDTEACVDFSTQNYDLTQKVEIPCGTCVNMDVSGDLILDGGLDVVGKLVFPANRRALKITTPFIFVQGEFIAEELANMIVPQTDRKLEFHFVGTSDVSFVSHHNQTHKLCKNGCNLSKKAFVVAGGKLDIRGMNSACPTWGRLDSVQDAGTPAMTAPAAPLAKASCGSLLVHEDFDSTTTQKTWDGVGSAAVLENGYFSVSQRRSSWMGPRVHLPVDCISANSPYVLKFRYRYRHSSTNETEFAMPYVKIMRYKTAGGSDWVNAPTIYSRGPASKAAIDEWHELELALNFDDDMADSTLTSDSTMHITPMEDVDNIDIDDFVLELAPPEAFSGRSCDDLLMNGQLDVVSDTGSMYSYPFYPKGGALTAMADASGMKFFHSSLRSSTWSSTFSQDIVPECLKKASIYEFSAQVRVDSTVAREVSVALTIDGTDHQVVVCPASSNNQWVTCTGKIRLGVDYDGVAAAYLSTRVLGDDTSEMDIANVSLVYQGGRAETLVLEAPTDVKNCWGPGAEVLVTSHTIQHEDSQTATIASVDAASGVITLVDPINKPITVQDDPNTAVEVALLTRNVLFTAAEDDAANPMHGGHIIIMHTSNPIVQEVDGIEIQGFGQQGKLGRYPFHFHMCESVQGSKLSKISIRDSKQRGIVVHGSDDLHVSENILFKTRGHAVMLEDGGEQGNVFERNLGAVGYGVTARISSDESDHNPSTFWITNPRNTWIGNVAAGSAFSGFWFEVKGRVRGPSEAKFPDMIPNKLDLLKFVDNVSHSNSQGVQTYPQSGYRPENLAVFEGHKSFRNRKSGIFFHAGGRLAIQGGYISDNPVGVDIDMDHSDVIMDTEIIGSTQTYIDVLEDMGYVASQHPPRILCDAQSTLVGVRLDSFHDGTLFGATGSTIKNVTFSGFDVCPGSSILHADSKDPRYFDTRNSVEDITVADNSPSVNLCGAEKQVAIRDIDGSLMGEAGFIVSDTSAIRAHPDCISVIGACAAFCPAVCLRTISIQVPSYYARGTLKLEVSGTAGDGKSITPIEVEDFAYEEIKQPQKEDSHSKFHVTLPAGGSYVGKFLLNGVPEWPLYTDLKYEDAVGNCGADFASFDVEQLSPSQCDSLVQNGNFESGASDFWWHIGSQELSVANEGADSSSFSLLSLNDASKGGGFHVGPGQYLDTRCIDQGYTYTISAKVKLTDVATGALFQCNPSAYSGNADACPIATLRIRNRLTDTVSWENVGKIQEGNLEWNTMAGSYVATSQDAEAHMVFLYINGARPGVNIQIDDVSLVRSYPSAAPVTPLPTPVPAPNPPFEFSSAESVSVFGNNIVMESWTQKEATVLSVKPHQGVGAEDEIELTVQLTQRQVSGQAGYQPNLVLFFAPPDTPIADVTTNDNNFGTYFEASVVAWMKEKIYDGLGRTWFAVKALDTNGVSLVSGSTSENVEMATSGALRLKRSNGKITVFYSFDSSGATGWTRFGSDYLLPLEYQTGPLKVGYRVKREWKNGYKFETVPTIVSGGEVNPAAAAAASYFDGTNVEVDAASCTVAEGCTLSGATNVAGLLSRETFAGDVSFTIELTERTIFGSGYQSGLWLFFADASAGISAITGVNDNTFKSGVIATVGDKIHATIDHTWMDMKVGQGAISQSGGDSYKNVNGYLKLQRIGGIIKAFMSPNGNTWKQIGVDQTLPSNLATVPMKIGLRIQKNWAPGYEMKVMTSIETP